MFGVPRLLVAALLAAACLVYAEVGTGLTCDVNGQTYYSLTDEQLISMRYARNLAEGHGLVWNAGEEPVEGYTNFLWTVWMAVPHLIGVPDTHVSLWVIASSALCLLGCALLAAGISRRLLPDSSFAAATALGLTAFYFPLMRWALTGFEVGALALLYTAAVYLTMRVGDEGAGVRERGLLALAFSLAILVRMDSAVSVTALSLYLLIAAPSWRERRQLALHTWLPTLAVVVLFEAWRLGYYGEFFPNTMYLKMGGVGMKTKFIRGWNAWGDILQTHLMVLVLPVVVALVDRRLSARYRSIIAVGFVGQWLYMLWIGGDTWEQTYFNNRQLSVTMPSLFVLTAAGLATLRSWVVSMHRSRVANGLVAFLLGVMLWSLSGPTAKGWLRANHCQGALFQKVALGLYLREHAPADTRVAVVWAGAIPYFSRLPAIDLLGKSDKMIARSEPHGFAPGHDKYDYAYSIGQLGPDVISSLWTHDASHVRWLESLGYRKGKYDAWYHRDLELSDP